MLYLAVSGGLKPDGSAKAADDTASKLSVPKERIATLEKDLQKARSWEGQDAAGKDSVRNGSSGNGASGATNAKYCLSETSEKNFSGNLPPLLSRNLRRICLSL